MAFVDFEKLKMACSIERCCTMLHLAMKKTGSQMRSACPQCKAGGDRALAVNLDGRFYCFSAKKGGDQIALVAHIKGDISAKEAAEHMASYVGLDTAPHHSQPPQAQQEGMQPLDYLDCLHESVEALGIPIAAADALGVGFANKGVMRGRVLIPLRLPTGALIGYCGIKLDDQVPFKFPDNLDERADGKVVQLRKKS